MAKNKVFTAIILGIVIRISPALDIIHELMHYGFCNISGIEVLELHWSSIIYARSSLSVLYGGYYGELILYSTLTLCCLYKRMALGGFFLGILLVVYFVSFGSMDFNELALQIYGDPAKVTAGLIRWGVISTIVVGIVTTSYYSCPKGQE